MEAANSHQRSEGPPLLVRGSDVRCAFICCDIHLQIEDVQGASQGGLLMGAPPCVITYRTQCSA